MCGLLQGTSIQSLVEKKKNIRSALKIVFPEKSASASNDPKMTLNITRAPHLCSISTPQVPNVIPLSCTTSRFPNKCNIGFCHWLM